MILITLKCSYWREIDFGIVEMKVKDKGKLEICSHVLVWCGSHIIPTQNHHRRQKIVYGQNNVNKVYISIFIPTQNQRYVIFFLPNSTTSTIYSCYFLTTKQNHQYIMTFLHKYTKSIQQYAKKCQYWTPMYISRYISTMSDCNIL